MLVKAIRQTAAGKAAVCLEDGSEISTSSAVITDLRIRAGIELDDAGISALKTESANVLCFEAGIEIVSKRLYSKKELCDKLARKGYSEDATGYAVNRLADYGFLDDETYAAAVARHYASKGFGPGRVRAELSKRGVDRELWDDAVGGMPDSSDKLDRFIRTRLKDPGDRDQIRKISGTLYRRGYSYDEIREAFARCALLTEDY